jgi:hypothetical protein
MVGHSPQSNGLQVRVALDLVADHEVRQFRLKAYPNLMVLLGNMWLRF